MTLYYAILLSLSMVSTKIKRKPVNLHQQIATERMLQLHFNVDHCGEVNLLLATSIITYSK